MMVRKITKFAATTLAAMAVPTLALAHSGVSTTGFMQGFEHPISGLDHVLAMVLVGAFAFQLGGRAFWLLPPTFVLAMAVGGGLGMMGMTIPLVESGIAMSVVILAAIVALDIKTSAGVALGAASLFAIFHGHAHGAEMPENTGGAVYALGFVIATAVLTVGGIGLASLLHIAHEPSRRVIRQSVGGIAAIVGVGLLAGQL
ncbi:HupE/UreJ family protein [Rhizobium ruizarguesonis]